MNSADQFEFLYLNIVKPKMYEEGDYYFQCAITLFTSTMLCHFALLPG